MMDLKSLFIKISILCFLSCVSCNSSSSVTPSPSSVHGSANATTSQPNPTTTLQIAANRTATASSASGSVTHSASGSVATSSSVGSSGGSPPSGTSVSPSASGSVATSSSVGSSGGSPSSGSSVSPSASRPVVMSSSVDSSGGSPSSGTILEQYLKTLTPEQKAVVKEFDMKRKDAVSKLEKQTDVHPTETSHADSSYLETMGKLMTDSQEFGKDFDKNGGKVNYNVTTKANAVQIKKFDCVRDRLSAFPKEVDPRANGAAANSIAVPLECPIEIIKDPAPSSRRRRDVEISMEMEVADLPMVEEDPEEYTHIYRYIRNKRSASQNTSQVCLHSSGNDCLDARLNATFRILNKNWTSAYNNKQSQAFKTMTNDIKAAMEESVRSHNSAWKVNCHSFELRPGSVVVSLYADTLKATQNYLITYLQSASSFGAFSFNQTFSVVKVVAVVHGGWSSWSNWPTVKPATYSVCGKDFKVNRTRKCDNPKPKHGGKECVGQKIQEKFCEFGDILTTAGTINTPYWNSKPKYPSNAKGEWILKASFNHTVELKIGEFELERDKKCFYDYVRIYDGNTTSAPVLLPRTCGTAGANKTIKSTGRTMLVQFRSDRSETFKGFTAMWNEQVKPWIRPKPVKYKEQNVTVTNVISCPMYNNTLVPLGKATTCLTKSFDSDCYFDSSAYIISCMIAVTANRNDLPKQDSAKINMTFKHIMHKDLFPSYYLKKKICVTWNTTYRKGNERAWSKKGCEVKSTNISHTVCECDHTGIFAVLATEEVVHKKFSLLANTYAGIGVSFIIVIIAILHIVWKVDVHGGEAMRINMCIAIIFMMMTFLIGANVEAEKHLCGFLAFLEYFSVVAQFFWLMLHGLRIHGKIKEIFASGMNIEMVYVCFGWGLPLLLSLIAIGIQVDIKNPHAVCWTAIAGGSMWGYGAPLLIVIMLNITVLFAVVAPTKERKTKYLYHPMMYRMVKDATLLALFGFTCIMAYLTVEQESFKAQYFLTVSVVLQAVAMIVFGREGRKDYVRREGDKVERDHDSENTNELSFGKFDDETSSNASSRMSHKDPQSPEKKGMKMKSSKIQETDVDA